MKQSFVFYFFKFTVFTLEFAAVFPKKRVLKSQLRMFLLYKVWPVACVMIWVPLVPMVFLKAMQFQSKKDWDKLLDITHKFIVGCFTLYMIEVEQLKRKVQETTENRKYVERILMESQRSKELLQRDHEELCNKMRSAVRVMVEAKETQEALEMKLDQRMHVIHQLQKSQVETEDRLDSLKDVLHEMKETIDLLHQDREDLKNKLKNHIHCKAERTLQQELKMLQRDKSVAEEQNSREKEMLLHRLRDHEHTIKEQHKRLRAFQEQLDDLNSQLREASAQLVAERHKHTQQLLTLQADKKKLELYIEEMQRKLANKTKPQLAYEIVPTDTPHSSPFTTSDSYDPPIRDHNKHYYRK